jgi:hypothetical protein
VRKSAEVQRIIDEQEVLMKANNFEHPEDLYLKARRAELQRLDQVYRTKGDEALAQEIRVVSPTE